MKQEMIVVLDYTNAVVHVGYIDEDETPQDYLKRNNFDEDSCAFMIACEFTFENVTFDGVNNIDN